MNTSHYTGTRLTALSLTLLFGGGLVQAQEGFKGAPGSVFTRRVKKAHTARRPASARVPPKAIEANERGNAHFDELRYEDAIAAYQEAIRLYARYAEGYLNLGDAYKELKRYEEAVNAYKQATKIKPNYGDAFNGLGDAYEAMGRKAEADDARSRANANFGVGGMLNGKALTLGRPSYPAVAKAARVSGKVDVRVLIDETGQVIRAEAISGDPLLQGAAVKAASESVFAPTLLGGQPVKVTGIIIYNFVLK